MVCAMMPTKPTAQHNTTQKLPHQNPPHQTTTTLSTYPMFARPLVRSLYHVPPTPISPSTTTSGVLLVVVPVAAYVKLKGTLPAYPGARGLLSPWNFTPLWGMGTWVLWVWLWFVGVLYGVMCWPHGWYLSIIRQSFHIIFHIIHVYSCKTHFPLNTYPLPHTHIPTQTQSLSLFIHTHSLSL